MQLYTANETANQNVWFDDFKVTFTLQLIVQENHYYPFGLELRGIEKENSPEHKFTYNGKEKQEEFGLNWLDYGARNYDAAVGRWNGIDVKAEKYYDITPYAYAGNMPTIAIDPNGEEIIITVRDKDGNAHSLKYVPGAKPPKGYRNNQFAKDMYKILNTIRKTKEGRRKINLLHKRNVRLNISQEKDLLQTSRYFPIGKADDDGAFLPGSISVNTLLGMDYGDDNKISPATGVAHEIDHAWKTAKLYTDFVESGSDPDSKEGKAWFSFVNGKDGDEEQRAVDNLERTVAEYLGDYVGRDYKKDKPTIYVVKDVIGGKGGRQRDDEKYNNLPKKIRELIEKYNNSVLFKDK